MLTFDFQYRVAFVSAFGAHLILLMPSFIFFISFSFIGIHFSRDFIECNNLNQLRGKMEKETVDKILSSFIRQMIFFGSHQTEFFLYLLFNRAFSAFYLFLHVE